MVLRGVRGVVLNLVVMTLFGGVAYQISLILDSYIMIHDTRKITVTK